MLPVMTINIKEKKYTKKDCFAANKEIYTIN